MASLALYVVLVFFYLFPTILEAFDDSSIDGQVEKRA